MFENSRSVHSFALYYIDFSYIDMCKTILCVRNVYETIQNRFSLALRNRRYCDANFEKKF